MENDRTQNKKTKKNKLERIAKIQYEKLKRIIEHKMNLHNSIARISQIAAIPVVMSFTADENTIKNINKDRNPNKVPTENTVGAVNSEKATIFSNFMEIQTHEIDQKFNEFVTERQEKFAQELYIKMTENIARIKQSKKQGNKSKILKETFGKSVVTKYYCSFGALTTINQVAESDDFKEFNFLNEYIENKHYCPSVIHGLKNKDRDLLEDINNYTKNTSTSLEINSFLKKIRYKLAKNPPSEQINKILADVKVKLDNSDDTAEVNILKRIEKHLEKTPIAVQTNNIKKEIAIQMEKNPNSVLIVVHNSSGNHTASGKHTGLVMKEVNPETYKKGETIFAGYNGEQIKNINDYFKGENNVGFIYNITEKAAEELRRNNYTEFENAGKKSILAWSEVRDSKEHPQEFDIKNMLLANAKNKIY